jgi:hypothetical protein
MGEAGWTPTPWSPHSVPGSPSATATTIGTARSGHAGKGGGESQHGLPPRVVLPTIDRGAECMTI